MNAKAEAIDFPAAAAPSAPHVYQAIAEIIGELARIGIGKNRKNQQQGFYFRAIDDVYGALAPLLAKHRLVILPDVIERTAVERQTRSGTAMTHLVLRMRYTLVSAVDGTMHAIVVEGEAADSGDKCTSKALSMAYKSMAFTLFAVPVEGQDDPDLHSHEISAVMPTAEYDALKDRVKETGGDVAKWENYMSKLYPGGIPVAEHAKITAGIERAMQKRNAQTVTVNDAD